MFTSSPFINLVLLILIFYFVMLINLKIIKKIIFPILLLGIVTYYLGTVSIKKTLNFYANKIINKNIKITYTNTKKSDDNILSKVNVGKTLINEVQIKNKLNGLINKMNKE